MTQQHFVVWLVENAKSSQLLGQGNLRVTSRIPFLRVRAVCGGVQNLLHGKGRPHAGGSEQCGPGAGWLELTEAFPTFSAW